MNSAKLSSVIVTETTIGKGHENDPVRSLTQYWASDGQRLASVDGWLADETEARVFAILRAIQAQNPAELSVEIKECADALRAMLRDPK